MYAANIRKVNNIIPKVLLVVLFILLILHLNYPFIDLGSPRIIEITAEIYIMIPARVNEFFIPFRNDSFRPVSDVSAILERLGSKFN